MYHEVWAQHCCTFLLSSYRLSMDWCEIFSFSLSSVMTSSLGHIRAIHRSFLSQTAGYAELLYTWPDRWASLELRVTWNTMIVMLRHCKEGCVIGFASIISLKHCYSETSSINPTNSKTFNVSRLVLHLSLSNPLKPCDKPTMKV